MAAPRQLPANNPAPESGGSDAPKAHPVAVTVNALLKQYSDALSKALPKFVNAEAFMRIAMTEIQSSPSLLACDVRSLMGAIFKSAQLGLPVDSTLGWAYLVPYKSECSLIVGYRGFIQLATRSRLVSGITASSVYKGDRFDWEKGTKPFIHHKPKLIERTYAQPWDEIEDVLACYSIAYFTDSSQPQFEVMSKSQIMQRAKRSPSYRNMETRSSPWKTDPVPMFLKTPTRTLCKWLPASTERLSSAVTLDEVFESGKSQDLARFAPRDAMISVPGQSELDNLADAHGAAPKGHEQQADPDERHEPAEEPRPRRRRKKDDEPAGE